MMAGRISPAPPLIRGMPRIALIFLFQKLIVRKKGIAYE